MDDLLLLDDHTVRVEGQDALVELALRLGDRDQRLHRVSKEGEHHFLHMRASLASL